MNNNENDKSRQNSTNINWYPGHMAKTKRLIEEQLPLIDIVYELVDARIPFSSKIKDVDRYLKNKPRILIMTKYDLCDQGETNKWIRYYETKGYHILPLNLEKTTNLNPLLDLTNEVMKVQHEKRTSQGMIKRRTRVLIIGVPNVGKSTLINRLVGKKAVHVGNKPGVTKQLNWIRINQELELLDSPGILWPKLEATAESFCLASFTAIKEEVLPLGEVAIYILKQLVIYYPNLLQERYGITSIDDDIVITLDQIGKRRGCLIKGGEVDYEKVYQLILNDIKLGHIKGITFDRAEELG